MIREAAGRLDDIEGHLATYDRRPGSLATHLEASHGIFNAPGTEAQEQMHEDAHQPELMAAAAALRDAEEQQ